MSTVAQSTSPPADFKSSVTPTPAGSSFVFAGDFNGDGIADVASPGADGIMRTYIGSTSGVFGAPVPSASATTINFNVIGNTVGDFDGDGHQDILMRGNVLYGNGNGTFTPALVTMIGNGQSGLVSDLNRDGKSDLLSVSMPQTAPGSYSYFYNLVAFLGTTQRGFTQVSTSLGMYPPGSGIIVPSLLAVSDLNGDGIPDAAIFDQNVDQLEIWLGNGDGSFRAGAHISLSNAAWSPEGAGGQGIPTCDGFIADLDGDGNPDLTFLATESMSDSNSATSVVIVEYGDGNGGLSFTQVIPVSSWYTSVVPMQLAAGALPGFALDDGAQVAVIRNLGGRQFSNEQFYKPGVSYSIAEADFNRDNLSDLLVTTSNPAYSGGTPPTSFTVLFNQPWATGNREALSNGQVSVSPSTVNYNQPFALTVSVQPAETGAPIPTGTVTLSTSTATLGTVQLSGGIATLQVTGATTQQFHAGILQIYGAYSGDTTYAASKMITALVVEEPQYPTTTTLVLSSGGSTALSIQAGTFLAMTAAVTAPVAIPHGVIAFFDDGTVLGQAEINSGGAAFTTNLLAPGSHRLSSQYMGYLPANTGQGTSIFLPSSSPAMTLTVNSIPTTITLDASSSTVTTGAVLTLNAQVKSGNGTPIGSVTFYDGTTSLGTYTLDAGGKAGFSTASLTTGGHSFSAQYGLNNPWAAGSSAPVTVTAQTASVGFATTTTIIASVTPGSGSSLLATVEVFGAPLGQGWVTLLVDGQSAATVPTTSSGESVIPLRIDSTGIHRLVASYGGSIAAAPSASPELDTTPYLAGQDFTLQPAQALASIPSGGSSEPVTLLFNSIGGWSGTVTLSCADGVPSGYRCVFSPNTLSGTGAITLTLVPQSGLPALGLLLTPSLLLLRRRRKRRHAGLVAVLLASLTILAGCGGNPGTQSAKSWVVTVQATSGSTLHATQIEFRSGVVR